MKNEDGSNESANKYQLTPHQRAMLLQGFQYSSRNFASGSIYGVFSLIIDHLLSSNRDLPSFSKAASTIVQCGVEMSSFDFVDSLSYAILQPDLSCFRKWIPWTCCTAAVSTVLAKAIEVPLENLEKKGKFSYKGYLNEVEDNILSSIGFNVAGGIANMYLPPPSKIGGKFIRSSARLVAANLGAHAAGYPLFKCKYGLSAKNQLKAFLFSLPMIPIQNALFRSSHHLVKSFAKIA